MFGDVGLATFINNMLPKTKQSKWLIKAWPVLQDAFLSGGSSSFTCLHTSSNVLLAIFQRILSNGFSPRRLRRPLETRMGAHLVGRLGCDGLVIANTIQLLRTYVLFWGITVRCDIFVTSVLFDAPFSTDKLFLGLISNKLCVKMWSSIQQKPLAIIYIYIFIFIHMLCLKMFSCFLFAYFPWWDVFWRTQRKLRIPLVWHHRLSWLRVLQAFASRAASRWNRELCNNVQDLWVCLLGDVFVALTYIPSKSLKQKCHNFLRSWRSC